MTLQTVAILRMTVGLTAAIGIFYAIAWPFYFIGPLFAAIFLVFPAWIGWKMAVQLLARLAVSLLAGLMISEYLLSFPPLCVLIYGLIFFYIYYNDTPTAPPMAALFMTLGVTMVPIMGITNGAVPYIIAAGLMMNMAAGLFVAWLFHSLVPNRLAQQNGRPAPKKPATPPPQPSREERVRLALVSTIVALTAVIIFFSFNLSSYAFAMLQICLMAGAPSANASLQAMKGNAIACCIGGVTIVIVYNLLTAVPAYVFLVSVCLCTVLLFSKKIYSDDPMAKAYVSALFTFLILLGTSTMAETGAAMNFYLRIVQILLAGLFTVGGIIVVERLLRGGIIYKKTAKL